MFSTCKSVNYDDFNKRSFLMEQSVQISSNTFWGTPFLEKGPPKITEGGPFDPRWLISKINPAYRIQLCTKNIQSNCCTVKKDVFFVVMVVVDMTSGSSWKLLVSNYSWTSTNVQLPTTATSLKVGTYPIGIFNPAILTKIFPSSRNPKSFYRCLSQSW